MNFSLRSNLIASHITFTFWVLRSLSPSSKSTLRKEMQFTLFLCDQGKNFGNLFLHGIPYKPVGAAVKMLGAGGGNPVDDDNFWQISCCLWDGPSLCSEDKNSSVNMRTTTSISSVKGDLLLVNGLGQNSHYSWNFVAVSLTYPVKKYFPCM